MSGPARCIYCGTTENLTREHAPPKFLFPRPWPDDFITVPACAACNQGGALDAEYFRTCLCLNPDARPGESLSTTTDAVRRSLERPGGKGFCNSILQAMQPLGDKVAFDADVKRLHRVVERIIQCLYFHETGKRLDPVFYRVAALGDDYLRQFDEAERLQIQRDFLAPLSQSDPTIIGGDVFAYASIHTGRHFVSVWGLLFYGSVHFIGLTGPREMKYGRICAASAMNASIYRCFEFVPDSVARVFVKKFAEQPHGEPQVHHTLRELAIGAYLASRGLTVQPEPPIDGKTPDWLIGPNALLEIVSLHAPKDVEEDIRKQCEKKRAAGALIATASYWPRSNTSRLYERIEGKARAYLTLVKERPYIVAVFPDFLIDVTDEEIDECLSGDGGLFIARPLLSGVVLLIERGGVYYFRYFANPLATNPFAFPAGSLDLHVDPSSLPPEWQ